MVSGIIRAGKLPIRKVLGMNRRNRNLIDRFNLRQHRKLADDKILCKTLLAAEGLPVAGTHAVVESMHDLSLISNTICELDHLVIKPAQGAGGSGITVLGPKTSYGWRGPAGKFWTNRDVRNQLGRILFGDFSKPKRNSDRAFIEERLFAGPIMGNMPVIGLPDIRVITFDSDPIMAMIRLPTRKSSGKANLHLGAVGVGVDLQTGLTTTATLRHRLITHHPDTKHPILNLQVASWDRILEIARGAARVFPLRYLGIDIAFTREQALVVLEVNVRPGLEIQNANQQSLRLHLEHAFAAQGPGGDDGMA